MFRPVFALCSLVLSALTLLAAAGGPALAQSPDPRLVQCQGAIEDAGQVLAERHFQGFQTCVRAVFECVQAGGHTKCLASARTACSTALGPMLASPSPWSTEFLQQVNTGCAGLSAEDLRQVTRLGHSAIPCSEEDSPVESVADLAACIEQQHTCRAQQLTFIQIPRAHEFLVLAGIDPAVFTCLDPGVDGGGKGIPGTASPAYQGPSAKTQNASKKAKAPKPPKISATAQRAWDCQAAIASSGYSLVHDFQDAVEPCLDGVFDCLTQHPGDETCLGTAKNTCASLAAAWEEGPGSLTARFEAAVNAVCPGRVYDSWRRDWIVKLLAGSGFGYAALAESCAEKGVNEIATSEQLVHCLALEHRCRAEQILARQVPRAYQLLEAGGVDPQDFACLSVEMGVVCGDGEQGGFEECDPPGAKGACVSGALCNKQCRCAASNPPEIDVDTVAATVTEGGELSIGVTATDPDGDPVTLSAGPLLPSADFDATNGTAPSGTFSFEPALGQQGSYAVTFTARDSWGLTDQQTVAITVLHENQAPTLTVPPTAAVDEGSILTLPVQGEDPEGDPLLFTASPDPLPANMLFIPATGTLTFTPDYAQAGEYSITFQVKDGALSSAPATCVITVNDVETGGPGQPQELILEVDQPQSPTLLKTSRITGYVNTNTGEPPEPPRLTSGLISGLSPSGGRQGATLTVTLTGQTAGTFATHFVNGVSAADFGEGISVLELTVQGPALAVATLEIDPDAPTGTRQVSVTTQDEVAISVVAFLVGQGQAGITGRVVDADTAENLFGALISIQGTGLTALTGLDGTFLFTQVPPGQRTLIVNAADHELVFRDIEARVGTTADTGSIPTKTTVYNPQDPETATVHSVLGRGVGDLLGRLTVDEARKVIQDALIMAGGTEVGVFDAYGNQLNPNLQGEGLLSLDDRGVQMYAERLAGGETISLLDMIYQMSFGLHWNGGPPPVADWLTRFQETVNRAWANPNDPASAIPILLFNQGNRLNPDPPVITGSTRVNKFQAFLGVSGLMTALVKNQKVWGKKGLGGGAQMVLKDDDQPTYTETWTEMIEQFGHSPDGPDPVSGGNALPGFEDLLKSYYLDQSPEALEQMREVLLTAFPGLELERVFEENPYGVKDALDKLIGLSEHDVNIRNTLQDISVFGGGGLNLWPTMKAVSSESYKFYYGKEFFPLETLWVNVIQRSMAPGSPYIYMSRESTLTLEPVANGVTIPIAKVIFNRSGDDKGDLNPADQQYIYRLWRIVPDKNQNDPNQPPGSVKASMILVGSGKIGESKKLAPVASTTFPGRFEFNVYLPPAGMNQYRMDVIRLRGDSSLLGAFDINSPEYLSRLKPWLRGYVDEPVAVDPFSRLGRHQIHPGQGWLHGYEYEISPMSNPSSVYIGGQGQGLARFGRIDLAADFKDNSKVYLSIPGWEWDPNSRGSGAIFRYDGKLEEVSLFTKDLYMRPGQIGLALDSNDNLYTENAASDESYGGRIFRYLGYRSAGDPDFTPTYPVGTQPFRMFVGSVNYYSRLLMRANPVMTHQIVMGPARDANKGEELLVADGMSASIKAVPVHWVEYNNALDLAWHSNGMPWAWTSTPLPAGVAPLGFDWQTDMCFDMTRTNLYITSGSYVVRTPGGADQSTYITQDGTLFQAASGCAVCSGYGEDYLFVSDSAGGKIFRFPLSDLPLTIPADATEKKLMEQRYTFIDGLNGPGQVRITDDGKAMVFTDRTGIRYQNFGFTGRALDSENNPLVGAVVTINTGTGPKSTTTDAEGYYNFFDYFSDPVLYASINHPKGSYTDRVTLLGKCNANLRPAPCVVITEPADGATTTATSTTVKGTIFPYTVDYTQSPGSLLELNNALGSQTYPLVFTGHGNDFEISGLTLAGGDNFLTVRVGPNGDMGAGGSLITRATVLSSTPGTQAVSGVVVTGDGNPSAGVKVTILVNGNPEATAETDSCGYYNKTGLPPGIVTTEVQDKKSKLGQGR